MSRLFRENEGEKPQNEDVHLRLDELDRDSFDVKLKGNRVTLTVNLSQKISDDKRVKKNFLKLVSSVNSLSINFKESKSQKQEGDIIKLLAEVVSANKSKISKLWINYHFDQYMSYENQVVSESSQECINKMNFIIWNFSSNFKSYYLQNLFLVNCYLDVRCVQPLFMLIEKSKPGLIVLDGNYLSQDTVEAIGNKAKLHNKNSKVESYIQNSLPEESSTTLNLGR